jgi:hypothetical protein
MTLEEIAAALPNGLHDAEVSRLAFDLVARTATLELEIWIGDMSEPPAHGREVYRAARLKVRGVAYLAIEPPDARYQYTTPGAVRIDLCGAAKDQLPPSSAGFAARLFVTEWNCFVQLGAVDAELIWTGEHKDRGDEHSGEGG